LAREHGSDEALLARFVAGDDDAFELLMKRHEDRIYALAFRMTGDRADALEATQDTFIAAFRQARSFRGDAAFSTWLYRVGINSCRDLLRKRARLPEPVAEFDEQPLGAAPAHVEEEAIDRIDLGRALADLPEDYREAVALHDLGGLAYDEIAAIASVPIGTIKSRISRGRKLLAKALEHPGRPRASKRQA
jgi:RNA polymerase sigma-70 factor (ECF subfamily)